MNQLENSSLRRNVIGGVVDTGAATPEVAERLGRFFAAKSRHDIEATHAFFHPDLVGYYDATLGWAFESNAALSAVWEQYMPTWPETGLSYETRIVGDGASAIAFLTDTPELFGAEIRAMAAIDFDADGRVSRWVDYRDGRHFGRDAAARLRAPAADFPDHFGLDRISHGRTIPAPLARVHALLVGDSSGRSAEEVLDEEVVWEDLTLHLTLRGRATVARYFERARDALPYGAGSEIRHVLGAAPGVAFEWANAAHPVPRGVTALEVAGERVTKATTVWDGAMLDDARFGRLIELAVEG